MAWIDRAQALLKNRPAWLAGLLAFTGLLFFVIQAVAHAHSLISNLDEGAYLYKGVLFATGQYRPFQLNGVLTNKAPLAFLIPGYVQLLFGPGLQTGRYLAILCASLGLLATWTAARRLAGEWLAAAAVWAFALNPALIKIYSQGVTQATIFLLLALVLALSLGAKRPMWQLVLSGVLTGVMILVRQNMILVLPLLFVYIWWEHGLKPALLAATVGTALLVLVHALYWPFIMDLWLPWMPEALQDLFVALNLNLDLASLWNPEIDLSGRLLSYFQGVRLQFVAMAGAAIGFVLWPRRSAWATAADFRAAVFLAALFVGLVIMHTWASITNDYCVFCFTPYLAFFNVTAILLGVLLVRVLERHVSPLRAALLVLVVLGIFAGTGFSAVEDWGDGLLNLNVPRVREGRVLPGFTTLWELLSNKFAIERNFAERAVSAAAGLLLGLIMLGAAYLVFRRLRASNLSFAYVLASLVLITSLPLSPFLAGSAGQPDCAFDVIAANRSAGEYLAQYIPPGSQAYWNGGLSVAPLLYAPGVKIYPAQINDGYSFRVGGDPQELLKYGLWNEALSTQWLAEADYVIVENWRYAGMKESLPPSEFDEMPRSPGPTSCLEGSGLRIFRRK